MDGGSGVYAGTLTIRTSSVAFFIGKVILGPRHTRAWAEGKAKWKDGPGEGARGTPGA